MNRGEGLRIAARAKHGTVGLFPEEKKVKKKQFGYKSRTQSYPVRKAETIVDSKDLGKQRKHDPHQEVSSAKQKVTTKESNPNQREKSATLNKNKATKGNDPKKPVTDFVKKNKALSGTSDNTKRNSRGGVTNNTITLTEEQLNAILQSIGSAPDRSSAPAIAIEDGKVKVENVSKVETKDTDGQGKEKLDNKETDNKETKRMDEKEGKSESSKNEKDEDDKKTVASENILSLLSQLEESEGANNAQTEVSSKPPSLPRTADSNNSRRVDQSGTPQKNSRELQWGNSVGMGNIGAAIGSQNMNTLTLQEKKRQEWKKALEEQVAEQKKRKEQEDMLWKSLDGSGLYHRQGTPQRAEKNTHSSISNSNVRKDFTSEVVTMETSSLGQFRQQSNVPAAMRSNFIIGGSVGQWGIDHNAEVKKKEQQEWIKEIEKQKREALERKDEERRRRQRMDDAVDSAILRTSVPSRAEPDQEDHSNDSKTKRVESSFLPTSDPVDFLSPRQAGGALSTQRGMTLIDPAELERREKAKEKHLEHMRAVQAQVEEKQRLKREADENRRREEAEEERRLALEREALQKQFDMENEKQRKKEEAAAAKQKALEEGIRNAEQEALAAKHARRVQRLNKQGHDTSNLRNSWDAQHVTETSPRQVVHTSQKSHHVLHSPVPLTETQNVSIDTEANHKMVSRDSPEEKRDVGTSTFSEQSTQTGFEFIPNLSPRLMEVIRQASAGIEYRARSETEGGAKHEKRTKSHEPPQKRNNRDSERPVGRGEKIVTERKPEKPKWGQNKAKKKISNSEKDLSKVGKGREARRRKRQEELLAQQERLTKRRESLKKRGAPSSSSGNNKDHDDNINDYDDDLGDVSSKPVVSNGRVSSTIENLSRDHSKLQRIRNEQDIDRATVPSRSLSRESPAIEGDFYPFLRSEDVKLNNQSVVVTPSREESPQKQTYFDTNTYSPSSQMDPLLNPERLKDSSQRQERILEQLSHLRQGLMMKQREIELGLSPTVMM